MMTRCFSPPLSVRNARSASARVPVASSAASRDGQIVRPLDFERAEVRIAAHQHDLEHGVVEGERRFLRHDGDPPRERRRPERSHVLAVEPDDSRLGLESPRQQPQQRGLAGSVRPENADGLPSARSSETSSMTRLAGV